MSQDRKGYVPYAGNVSINKAENQLNVTLSTTVESEFTKVTYQTGRYHNNLSAGGESFGLYVKHTAASLRKYIGTSIRQVRVFSPNTTDMQLRIYNNTDEEPIYTRDVTVTEEMTNSYTTLDFNEGEIVIEPGKDYYIGFDYANYSDMGTGAFDDDTSLTYEGIANILTLGNQWGSAFWGTGQAERGNYMLDVFFGAESIVEKPTSVTMQATAEVNLNYTTQLTALFAPATASQFASWNSSDVDVARVNENGVVTALGEGTTTITAVSIFNPAVLSRCVVTVTAPRSATLTGRVLDQAGQPVVGAKITFAKRAASNAPAGVINNLLNQASPMPLLARSAAKVEDQPLRTASYAQGTVITTDQSGAYTITGLEAMASYTLNVAPNTNLLLSGSVNVAPLAAGTSTLDLILNPNPTLTMSELKYHNNQPSYGVGMGSASMNFIIAIDSTTYGNNGGKLLSHVELNIGELYQDNTAVSISIFHERDIHHALQGAFWRVYQPGKIMINLADLGMTIPKDEKIYLNIIVTGTLMMDKSTPAVEGYGNLYFNEKTNAIEPITKRGDYPGNWAVSTYMVDKDPVLVDWIDISSKTGTSDLPVGRTMALDADVQPWSSDYRHVNWRSMDESVATVDKNGVVTGVGEGSTWIVAKAKDSRGAQGGFEVNVQNRQAAEGVVKTTEGQPAAGAQMTFTLVEPMSQSYGKLSLHSYSKILTKSDPITTTVGEDGKYSVNIPEGQYELSIQKEGCVELKQVVTIATGLNDKMDYTLMTAFQLNSTQLTYCNNWLNNAVSNGGGEFTVAARWTKEDLKQHVGSNITRLRYATLAAGAHIELVVLANGDLSRPLLKIDVPSTAAGWSSLDLTPAQYVKIPADTEISFGYTIVMHDPNSNVAGIDMEQAIDGKGNLIYVEGAWHNVSEFSIGGNWQLGMYVQTADQVDGIDLRVGQEKVSLSWGAATYTSYQVSYAQVGAELGEAVKVDKPSYTFTNLLPGKSYTYRIDGSNDGDYFVPMFTKQFTTKARVTDIPAINIDVYEVIEGTPIRLDVLNTLAGDAIVWKIDGQVVTTSEVTLGVGTHEIRTEIKRAGTTYVTKRRVVVKAN